MAPAAQPHSAISISGGQVSTGIGSIQTAGEIPGSVGIQARNSHNPYWNANPAAVVAIPVVYGYSCPSTRLAVASHRTRSFPSRTSV